MLSEDLEGTTHTMAYTTADELCWAYVGTSSDACGTTPSGAVTYRYDNDGNQTNSSAGLALVYNPANQAVSMTNPTGGNVTPMAYAGIGNAQRVTAGSTTYNNNTFGVATASTSGSTTYFTYDPSGKPNSIVTAGARYYYLYDGLGNIIGLINTSGTQQAAYTYDPYGNTSSSGTEASANPLQYEAGYADPTGYTHFGARYQNPIFGAWTQQDPSGQNSGYNYAGSNPINAADPSGNGTPGDGPQCSPTRLSLCPGNGGSALTNIVNGLGDVNHILGAAAGSVCGAAGGTLVGEGLAGPPGAIAGAAAGAYGGADLGYNGGLAGPAGLVFSACDATVSAV